MMPTFETLLHGVYTVYFILLQVDASVQTDPVCIVDEDPALKHYPVNTRARDLDHAYSRKEVSPMKTSTPSKRKTFIFEAIQPESLLPCSDSFHEECPSPIEDFQEIQSPDDLEVSMDVEVEEYDPKDETYQEVIKLFNISILKQ